MRSFGLSELIVLAALVSALVFALEWRRLKVKGPTLSLREFRIEPTNAGYLIIIRGRPRGFWAFLMSVFGLEATTSLLITDKEVKLETSSVHGMSESYAPLAAIASAQCVYFRAFFVLIAAFLAYAAGAFGFVRVFVSTNDDYQLQIALNLLRAPLWTSVVVGTILYSVYALSKRLGVAVQTIGGMTIGVLFKRSMLEKVTIGLDEARKVAGLLNKMLLDKYERKGINPGDQP